MDSQDITSPTQSLNDDSSPIQYPVIDTSSDVLIPENSQEERAGSQPPPSNAGTDMSSPLFFNTPGSLATPGSTTPNSRGISTPVSLLLIRIIKNYSLIQRIYLLNVRDKY